MSASQESPHYVNYTRAEMLQSLVIGAVVGLLVWVFTWALNEYVFNPLMCDSGVVSKCSDSYSYSLIVGQVLAAIVGLIALVQRQIYRPLLVVLAATATLWGLLNVLSTWTVFGTMLASAVLMAFAYLAFMLLARIRLLYLSFVVIAVLVVVTRVVLNS